MKKLITAVLIGFVLTFVAICTHTHEAQATTLRQAIKFTKAEPKYFQAYTDGLFKGAQLTYMDGDGVVHCYMSRESRDSMLTKMYKNSKDEGMLDQEFGLEKGIYWLTEGYCEAYIEGKQDARPVISKELRL